MGENCFKDQADLFNLKEDPDLWEELVRKEIALGYSDPVASAVIESMYWEEDRETAFQRFLQSLDFSYIRRVLSYFGVSHPDSISEIGGGNGQLVWALSQVGFQHLTLLEPNSHYITGTGYLRWRPDARAIMICNDLTQWYASPEKYQVIITRNCVHHFKNISMTAASIRQKIEPSGLWFMFREWYADSPLELYSLIRTHPYCQKYGVYEYPFPASHYIEATEIAGFKLIGIVPARYSNDCLGAYVQDEGLPSTRRFTWLIDRLLQSWPKLTVLAYQTELFANRYLRGQFRWFTRPQVMIFRRVEVK
jgi:hypothetical protein